jgi:hypothetical protein
MSQATAELEALLARVEHHMPAAARRAVVRYCERSPLYHGEVSEHLHLHMAHTSREFGRLLLRVVRTGQLPAEEDLRRFTDRARQRSDEGLPAAELLDAYFVMAEVLWEEFRALGGEVNLVPLASALLAHLHRVACAAIGAHEQEYQAVHSEEHEAVRSVVSALIIRERTGPLPERTGIRLADTYAVIAVHLAEHPAERESDPLGQRIAGRRKANRVRDAVERTLGPDSLCSLDTAGGIVLAPSSRTGEQEALRAVRAALPRWRSAAGTEVTAAVRHAPDPAALPAAAEQARELLRLALAAGRAGDAHALEDLLVEYHLSRPSPAREVLASVVNSLRAVPDLLDTLAAYVDHDFNRRRTARCLGVHPNTVDNRLARIADLTGADPSTAQGLITLANALTAARFAPPACPEEEFGGGVRVCRCT